MPASTPSKSPKKAQQKSPGKKAGKKAAGKKQAKAQQEEEELSLYEITKQPNVAIATVVDEWLDRYKENQESATLELVNYVIEASGTNVLVSADTFAEGDLEYALEQLEKEKAQEDSEYPVASKKKEMKKFSKAFMDFWKKLLVQCKNSLILFDDYLMDTTFSWLVAINGASLRSFRHTTTLVALQIITSLVNVALEFRKELDSTQRLLSGEKKSASQKASSLSKKSDTLNQRIEAVEQKIIYLFDHVFPHRFRDTFPDIRAACVQELGVWVNLYTHIFLDETYLKYIGWQLNDRVADVRGSAVKVLAQKLYGDADHVSQLNLFTKKFKARIIEIAESDIDPHVQAAACALVTEMSSLDLLTNEEKGKIYGLVGCENGRVRDAVGKFIYQNVLRDGDEQIAKLESGKASKKGSAKLLEIQKKQIITLVDFILEYHPIPDMPHYVVDALWDKTDLLKQWEAMAAVANDPSVFSTEEHQGVLLAFVNATIHKAVDKPLVELGLPPKLDPEEKYTPAQEKAIKASSNNFTHDFTDSIADLLEANKGDASKLENLLELIYFFDVTTIQEEQKQKVVEQVLDVVKDIFFKHTEEGVLHNCMRVVKHFIETIKLAKAEEVRTAISNELTDKLKLFNPKREKNAGKSVNGYELVACLQRAQILLLLFNASHTLENQAADVSQQIGTIDFEDDEDVESLKERSQGLGLSILFQLAAWKLLRVKSKKTLKDGDDDLKQLVDLRKALIEQIETLLSNYGNPDNTTSEITTKTSPAIAEKAFLLATDLMVLFSTSIANEYDEDSPFHDVVISKKLDEFQKSVVGYFKEVMFAEGGLLSQETTEETEPEKEVEKPKKPKKAAKAKPKAKKGKSKATSDDEDEDDDEEEYNGKGKGKKGKKGKGKGKGKKAAAKKSKQQEESDEEEEAEEEEEVEKEAEEDVALTEKKEKVQNLILSMCRAIRYGAMPWTESAYVLRVYAYSSLLTKPANDIIKELLHVAREQDPENEWRYVYSAMLHQYDEVLKLGEMELKDEISTPQFFLFKELCLKLSLTYGLVANKFKLGVSNLVYEGSYYALGDNKEETAHYSFFIGLEYFSSRLPMPQARAVLKKFLEKEEDLADKPNKTEHSPFFTFKENLTKRAKPDAPTPKTGSAGKKRKGAGKKAAPTVRKLQLDAEEEQEEGEEDQQQEEEEEVLEDTRKTRKNKKQKTQDQAEDEQEQGSQKKRDREEGEQEDDAESPKKRGRGGRKKAAKAKATEEEAEEGEENGAEEEGDGEEAGGEEAEGESSTPKRKAGRKPSVTKSPKNAPEQTPGSRRSGRLSKTPTPGSS